MERPCKGPLDKQGEKTKNKNGDNHISDHSISHSATNTPKKTHEKHNIFFRRMVYWMQDVACVFRFTGRLYLW